MTDTPPNASEKAPSAGPLAGLRVIDCATLFAGPLAASMMADFGADVIKIEHPSGDPLRQMGYTKDGHGLWWKVVSRNKRCVVLNLKEEPAQTVFRALVRSADVLIENFRTGTLESWGLGWEELRAINPRLVMLRVTGFGQTGPYAKRAGFGTLAEAMSGFAHITGPADGPPTLPPFGLADGIAAYYGTFATMFALYERDAKGSGEGQVIDLSLYEPLYSLLGAQTTVFDQLGIIQNRIGNRSVNNAPRNAYKCADGKWVALSAAAPSIVRRVLTLTGGPEVAADPRFQTNRDRVENVEEIDQIVGGWIAKRSREDVIRAFEEANAAIGPIYDVADFIEDEQVKARGTVATVEDEDLGPLRMQNVFPALSRTPGRVKFAGPRHGQHNRDVLEDLKSAGHLPTDFALGSKEEAAE